MPVFCWLHNWCVMLTLQDISFFDEPRNQVGSLTAVLANDSSQVEGVIKTFARQSLIMIFVQDSLLADNRDIQATFSRNPKWLLNNCFLCLMKWKREIPEPFCDFGIWSHSSLGSGGHHSVLTDKTTGIYVSFQPRNWLTQLAMWFSALFKTQVSQCAESCSLVCGKVDALLKYKGVYLLKIVWKATPPSREDKV